MRRLASGNPQLDQVLGGGFPEHSTTLVMGLPGTGKTILAQSIAFEVATTARPALILSTVSEPLDRMLRYVQEFTFFDAAKVGDAILYEDLNEILRTSGTADAVRHIIELLKEHRPAVLVIDSFKALHSFSDDERSFRTSLAELSGVLATAATSTFLIGEYEADEVPQLPEFAVADAIVELVLKKVGVRDERFLRVIKLRGSSYLSGEHAFRLSPRGMTLFPRLQAPTAPVDYLLTGARLATGVQPLDTMLHDGLWQGSSTLVLGPAGSGKTLLGLHFIFKGIEMGERGLIATMQENPTQLQRIVAGFGWDLTEAIKSKALELMYVSPVDLYIDEFVSRVAEAMAGKTRLLIDSLNDLERATSDEARFKDFMYSLNQTMSVAGVSTVMTEEVADLFNTARLSQHGISHISDNVILLSYLRDAATIRRTITVIKTRASEHQPDVREFVISPAGLEIGQAFGAAVDEGPQGRLRV